MERSSPWPPSAPRMRASKRGSGARENAIPERGVPGQALPDGMTVRIDARTAYELDALVHWGERLPDEIAIVASPVIVVEVLSPKTSSRDVGAKLADYFRVPTIHHYLIARTDRP